VGHTGTLDPFATGVLVVLVGRATRLAQFLSTDEKEYEATIRFGYSTDTGDATGQRKEEVQNPKSKVQSPVGMAQSRAQEVQSLKLWTDAEIEAALKSLRGAREQVPPMYSAKKVEGRKLYELARRGEEIERRAVPIRIHELAAVLRGDRQLLRQNPDGTRDMEVRVVCSAGTYVRVLAEEIGERLGTGAHLAALRRTRAGQFRIEQATTVDELQNKAAGDERAASDVRLLAPDAALSFMPFVHLSAEEARRAAQGVGLRVGAAEAAAFNDGAAVRMRDESGSLIAIGAYHAPTLTVRPRVVLSLHEK
jgi:tRNA pseudouridine55 synthase